MIVRSLNSKLSTYVFDLDGTLCEQMPSEKYHLALPIDGRIDMVNSLYDFGHKIIIYTARGMRTYRTKEKAEERYLDETCKWLLYHGVKFDSLIMGKPVGDFFIDDKGLNASDFFSF